MEDRQNGVVGVQGKLRKPGKNTGLMADVAVRMWLRVANRDRYVLNPIGRADRDGPGLALRRHIAGGDN